MDFDNVVIDGFGMALGLGEEIAIEKKAIEISQTDGSALEPLTKELTLVPLSPFTKSSNLVDLTDMNNWLVPMTKRLRSPFIEKWKRVALGHKEPSDPLLTYEEEEAYHMATDNIDDDNEAQKITSNLKNLKRLNSEIRLKNMGKRIDKLRYSDDEA